MKRALAWLAIAAMSAGCMPSVKKVTTDPRHDEVEAALNAAADAPHSRGSLWTDGGSGMFSDAKAHRVGDLVTVLVVENAKATRKLGMKKSKKSGRDLSGSFSLDYGNAKKNASVNPTTKLAIGNSKTFDGSGSTTNSDTLTASVTSVVTRVYPNGNMRIVGRRLVSINHQPQVLTFTGVIRPNDIGPDNTIPSSKVAQAEISYGGGGELATVAHEGWLSRTLDQIWPF